MRKRTLLVFLSAFAAVAHAQTASTAAGDDGEDDSGLQLQLAQPPPPMLTFVSPDTSLVARPDEVQPEPTPAPTVAPMRITIEAAHARDGAATVSFPSTTPDIFIRWRGENLPVGATVRVAWIAEDVGDLIEPGFIIDQNETLVETPKFGARFTLSSPRDGWAPGKYRVDLFVDDELRDTLGVTIRD